MGGALQAAQALGLEVLADHPQRFSLAGAHEKQPVVFDGRNHFLSDRRHPSTHILKSETVPRMCIAQYLAERAADEFVAEHGQEPALQRFVEATERRCRHVRKTVPGPERRR